MASIDYEAAMAQLQAMFSGIDRAVIHAVLESCNGHMESTVEGLLAMSEAGGKAGEGAGPRNLGVPNSSPYGASCIPGQQQEMPVPSGQGGSTFSQEGGPGGASGGPGGATFVVRAGPADGGGRDGGWGPEGTAPPKPRSLEEEEQLRADEELARKLQDELAQEDLLRQQRETLTRQALGSDLDGQETSASQSFSEAMGDFKDKMTTYSQSAMEGVSNVLASWGLSSRATPDYTPVSMDEEGHGAPPSTSGTGVLGSAQEVAGAISGAVVEGAREVVGQVSRSFSGKPEAEREALMAGKERTATVREDSKYHSKEPDEESLLFEHGCSYDGLAPGKPHPR